ncbi:MAG TPA: hypothetical protein VD994_15900 [Prosthecobacter sp.]|nr:hypothetical protein [Prosthecobacter sp.]
MSDRPTIKNPPPSPPEKSRTGIKTRLKGKERKRWEYKEVNYFRQNMVELFNFEGMGGWRFKGHAAHGPAIFERELTDDV